MFYFNPRLLIHTCTCLEYSYWMFAWEFWSTSVCLIFYPFPCILAEGGQLFIHLIGWLCSHCFGWEINACKSLCMHLQTNRFVRQIWLEVVFFLSVFLHKTPCEINATQTKHLQTAHRSFSALNYGKASGRWKLLFYFIRCFPFSPSKPL